MPGNGSVVGSWKVSSKKSSFAGNTSGWTMVRTPTLPVCGESIQKRNSTGRVVVEPLPMRKRPAGPFADGRSRISTSGPVVILVIVASRAPWLEDWIVGT